jgi:Family of unknown function (DUF6065)
MIFSRSKNRIEFLCRPEDKGVIAEPIPAKACMPDWFRKIPAIDKDHLTVTNNGFTVKKCMPFLDALTTGWIIPLAATVRLEITDEGKTVNTGWEFDQKMTSFHGKHQVAGNPRDPRPPCKFHNFWTIRTPPGWSCLFVPPLNRPNPVFEVAAGVVDTDEYQSIIHFPFFATGPDGVHVLEKGTPIVQVIPFRRADVQVDAVVRSESEQETGVRKKIFRNTISGDGWYRNEARGHR